MTETNIPVSEDTRRELRQYKAADGQTYDEAIRELLSQSGWFDE